MKRLQIALLWSGALLPAVTACAMTFVSHATPEAPRKPKPSLAFDQYMVNLREVPPSRYVTARFLFTNTSDQIVTVKDLQPSCGCLQPRLEKRIYQPGETGEFHLLVDTALQEPGPHEYFVKMLYEDDTPQETDLRFQFELAAEKVVVRPKSLIFYQMTPKTTTQEILITDYRQGVLAIESLKSFSPFVTATVGEVKIDGEGNQQIPVKITVSGSIPFGKHQGLLKLKTDDPLYPELTIPLMIYRTEAQLTEEPGKNTIR